MQLRASLVGSVCFALAPAVPAQIVFGPAQTTPLAGTVIPHFATGDLDGDGFDDLVIGNLGAPGLRLGDGQGQFGPELPIDTDAAGGTVAVADMNGDRVLDLVVGSSQVSALYVALADGAGGFQPAFAYTLGGATLANKLSVDVRDGDGDGDVDVLAVTPAPPSGSATGDARLLRNLGDGHLGVVAVFPGGQFQPRIVSGAMGDLDRDGRPDVVLSTNAGQSNPIYATTAWLCQPDATFAPSWTQDDVHPLRLADLDSDGDLDVLTVPGEFTIPEVGAMTAMLNAGDGTFSAGPTTTPYDEAMIVGEPADLDGDGLVDLLMATFPSPVIGPVELWSMRGAGDGGFDPPGAHVSLGVFDVPWQAGALGDFDGDGRPDIAVGLGAYTTTPAIGVALDRSYATGGPLLDLGHQLLGAQWPILIASGSFLAGQAFAFDLSGAPPSGTAYLILGFTQLLAPFKGGVMVPMPTLILGPFPTSPSGGLALAGTWPSVPPGLELDLQFWVPDAAGPAGFAASSGVRITTP